MKPYYWSFKRTSAARWALVLIEDRAIPEPVRELLAPGYESKRLLDILRACWYLNGGFVGDLREPDLKILDTIREDVIQR